MNREAGDMHSKQEEELKGQEVGGRDGGKVMDLHVFEA